MVLNGLALCSNVNFLEQKTTARLAPKVERDQGIQIICMYLMSLLSMENRTRARADAMLAIGIHATELGTRGHTHLE